MSCWGQTLLLLSQWVYRSIDVCEGVSFNSAVSLSVLSRCGFGVCRPETERSDRVSARKKELCWSHGDLPHTLANTHTHTHKHTNQTSKPSFAASVCEVCLPSAIDFSFRIMAPSSAGSLTPAGSEFHRPDSDFDWCASDGSSCGLVCFPFFYFCCPVWC